VTPETGSPNHSPAITASCIGRSMPENDRVIFLGADWKQLIEGWFNDAPQVVLIVLGMGVWQTPLSYVVRVNSPVAVQPVVVVEQFAVRALAGSPVPVVESSSVTTMTLRS